MRHLLSLATLSSLIGYHAVAAAGLNTWFTSHSGKRAFGAVVDNAMRGANPTTRAKLDFGAITTKGALEWSQTEASQNQFLFTNLDNLVIWAASNNLAINGYAIVSPDNLPSWLTSISSSSTLRNALENHVSAVASRFPGLLSSWVVVTNPLNTNGSLRSSVFSQVLGESYISVAFAEARASDPSAKLYISDSGVESNNAKLLALLSLVGRVNSSGQGRLIDGITIQAASGASTSDIESALGAIAAAGLEATLTQVDGSVASSEDFTTFTSACLGSSACVSVTTFGICDGYDATATSYSSSLFNAACQPKAAYTDVISL